MLDASASGSDGSGGAAAAARKWGSGWGPSTGVKKGRAAKDPAGKQQPVTETPPSPPPPPKLSPIEARRTAQGRSDLAQSACWLFSWPR